MRILHQFVAHFLRPAPITTFKTPGGKSGLCKYFDDLYAQ